MTNNRKDSLPHMQDGSQLSALVGNLLSEEGEDSTPEFEVETGFDPTVEPSTPAETGSTDLDGDGTDFDPTTTYDRS
jgi:hypothetical protein